MFCSAALFKSLTGIDVVELCEGSPSIQVVLDGVKKNHERQGTLLLPALAELAGRLKHLHLQGGLEWARWDCLHDRSRWDEKALCNPAVTICCNLASPACVCLILQARRRA